MPAFDEDTETRGIAELFLEIESDHIEVTTERDPDSAVERVATDRSTASSVITELAERVDAAVQ